MSSSDVWGILMALLAIILPLGLAWLLLARGDRKRDPAAGSNDRHPR
jgi:hypothetical protein